MKEDLHKDVGKCLKYYKFYFIKLFIFKKDEIFIKVWKFFPCKHIIINVDNFQLDKNKCNPRLTLFMI